MEKENRLVLKNTCWLLLESVLTMFVSLIVGVISARYLGPSNYGLINRFTPYISLANSICTFGLQSIVIRDISRDKSSENIRCVIGSTMFFRLFLSTIAAICIDAFAFFVSGTEGRVLFVIAVIQSFSLVFNCYEIITYYFQALLKSQYIAVATVFTSILVGAWKIVLLINKASVEWFAASTTLHALLLFVFNFFFFKKEFRPRVSFNYTRLKRMVGDGFHLLLASMGIAIYGQVDQIMIGHQLGNLQLGFYDAAYLIATMWYFVPNAIANSFRSKMFSVSDNEQVYAKNTRILFLLISTLGICAGIVITFFPRLFIKILYGAEYMDATSALMILGWCGLFANVGTVRSIWLVGKGLHKYSKYFTLMGAVLNVATNAILIPVIGIKGAAIATAFSQMAVQILFPLFFKQTRPVVKELLTCYTETGYLLKNGVAFVKEYIKRK